MASCARAMYSLPPRSSDTLTCGCRFNVPRGYATSIVPQDYAHVEDKQTGVSEAAHVGLCLQAPGKVRRLPLPARYPRLPVRAVAGSTVVAVERRRHQLHLISPHLGALRLSPEVSSLTATRTPSLRDAANRMELDRSVNHLLCASSSCCVTFSSLFTIFQLPVWTAHVVHESSRRQWSTIFT